MTEEVFKVPSRIEKAPDWLLNRDEEEDLISLQGRIADDLIAIGFWKMVDMRTEAIAKTKCQRLKGWVVTLPPEQQSDDLKKKYEANIEESMGEIVDLMGRDYYTRARLLAGGADMAFDKASRLMESMEQAQTTIALKIKEDGLLPYLEHSSVAEFLLTKRAKWDGDGSRPGSWYETEFLIDVLVPTLDANGFDRELVLGVAKNFYKARYAVPYLRTVLKEVADKAKEIKAEIATAQTEDEKVMLDHALTEAMQLDTRVYDILKVLIDEINTPASAGGMSNHDFRREMVAITGNRKAYVKDHGITYIMGDGGVLYIKCATTTGFNAIQRMLSDMVDWHLGSPEDMAKESIAYLQNQTLTSGKKK